MTDDPLLLLKAQALKHLENMPKPKADASATEWKNYAEFWTKFTPEDKNAVNDAEVKLLADIQKLIDAMTEKLQSQVVDDLKSEVRLLKEQIKWLEDQNKPD